MVRRDDHHCLDSILPRRLGLRHLRVVAVSTILRNADIGGRSTRAFGIGAKSSRDEFCLAIQTNRHPMYCADESVAAAADHSVTHWPLSFALLARINHCSINLLCLVPWIVADPVQPERESRSVRGRVGRPMMLLIPTRVSTLGDRTIPRLEGLDGEVRA